MECVYSILGADGERAQFMPSRMHEWHPSHGYHHPGTQIPHACMHAVTESKEVLTATCAQGARGATDQASGSWCKLDHPMPIHPKVPKSRIRGFPVAEHAPSRQMSPTAGMAVDSFIHSWHGDGGHSTTPLWGCLGPMTQHHPSSTCRDSYFSRWWTEYPVRRWPRWWLVAGG